MLTTIGRILVGLVFTYMGIYKILNWGATADWMAMKGLPIIPALLVAAILIEVGGGVLLIFGKQIKWTAIVLAVFLVPTNIIFHNFWAMPAEQVASEFLSFLQNIAIMGGLLSFVINRDMKVSQQHSKVVNL